VDLGNPRLGLIFLRELDFGRGFVAARGDQVGAEARGPLPGEGLVGFELRLTVLD
jgi:hypothetical protein